MKEALIMPTKYVKKVKKPLVLKYIKNIKKSNLINFHDFNPTTPVKITNKLRSLGYPTPHYFQNGKIGTNGLYWIIEEIMGEPIVGEPTIKQLKDMINLLYISRGNAIRIPRDWSKVIKENLFGKNSKMKNIMEKYSLETAQISNLMLKSIQKFKNTILPNDDLIHGDYSYKQVMVLNNHITGVIDWEENSGIGDYLFDLTRLIYSLHDRRHLIPILISNIKTSDLPKINIYTAYIVYDMLTFPIQSDSPGMDIRN